MSEIVTSAPEQTRRIDAIDRKILRVLQEDASLSVAEIGERVGLSHAVLEARPAHGERGHHHRQGRAG
jgi:hypothetical protein